MDDKNQRMTCDSEECTSDEILTESGFCEESTKPNRDGSRCISEVCDPEVGQLLEDGGCEEHYPKLPKGEFDKKIIAELNKRIITVSTKKEEDLRTMTNILLED